ncbi:MAG TPA: folate-binding protein [Candidatus Angelobacter sp.]|nr:folate-binding protein [Candidatus Angelobacter sp.]
MSQTALYPWLASSQAQTGPYNGVETALSFGSPAGELETLCSGCGVFALPWRTQISVTGNDRARWLHNMVTNNVRDLAVNRGNYNFVLNAQGRILGDLYIYNRGESLALETDSSQIETLVSTMRRFIIMDKVELTPAGPEIAALAICGARSGQVLSAAGIDTNAMTPLEIRDHIIDGLVVTLIAGPAKKPHWFEIWIDSAHAHDLWSKLTAAGAQPVGAQALEMWRVLHGIPNYGQDIRDRDLPQETGQADALNFNKGCYIGQEIVERIRSRGQVHRQFVGFEFPGAVPALGKYESEGRARLEITSVTRVPAPAGEKNIGLGYVRREALAAGPEIDLNGVAARIVELPFKIEEH